MIPLEAQPIGTRSGELVINWHLTEACNYACRYCYSKWHATETSKELIHDPDAGAALVNEIYRQFAPTPRNHPIGHNMAVSSPESGGWRAVALRPGDCPDCRTGQRNRL